MKMHKALDNNLGRAKGETIRRILKKVCVFIIVVNVSRSQYIHVQAVKKQRQANQ